jgi:hypothetical protein
MPPNPYPDPKSIHMIENLPIGALAIDPVSPPLEMGIANE